MRPGQNNKRLRGRSGRKGPNPLTRSYESNGPDVKIRGTAQHVAEKYLQLARDAQSSGDTIMAESLLQHAEHYFRLIAAAQVQQNAPNGGFGRQNDAEVDYGDDDDDFSGLPDRFAPLAERLPPPPANFAPPGQPYQAPSQPQGHFAPPQLAQPQPQPFEERPYGGEQRHERPARHDRPYNDRNRDRGRDRDSGDRPQGERPHNGFERNRDNRRFPPRVEQAAPEPQPAPREAPRAIEPAIGLPAFITAPVIPAPPRNPEVEAPAPFQPEDRGVAVDQEPAGFHLTSRRRRRPRPPVDETNGAESAPQPTELPLGD
jgi:hypothetical protein